MGAASSFLTDVVPEDIRTLIEVIEKQKTKIAEADNAMIEKETNKMFKGHNVIVDTLVGRTKSQIKLMLEKFPSSEKNLTALVDKGNHYAKFIKYLALPKAEIEMEAIRTSSQADYDEELLINIIGTSSISDIKKLDELFQKEKSFSLGDLFASNAKKDSQLAKFVAMIMTLRRSETKEVDEELARRQAEILHKAGASKLIGVEEDPIFNILSSVSRFQCSKINEVYQDMYKMKLERAINMKFKGNCGKLMVLWTKPINESILNSINYSLQKMIVDKMAIGLMLAKYEKDVISSIDEACSIAHSKPLSDLIAHGVSGNLLRAYKGWIESPSPDKGFERILTLYLEGKIQSGLELTDILSNIDLTNKFLYILEKEGQELKLYMIEHKIKLDPDDQAILSKPHRAQPMPSGSVKLPPTSRNPETSRSPDTARSHDFNRSNQDLIKSHSSDENAINTARSLPPAKFQSSRSLVNVAHDKLCSRAYNFLVAVMEKNDIENEGCLDSRQFWDIIRALPLEDFGLSEKDINTIKRHSDWEHDGMIFYYEVLFEFSESVISSIENKEEGDNDPSSILDKVTSDDFPIPTPVFAPPSPVLLKSRQSSINMFPKIPMFFRQFLLDTMTAFDFNCSGYLTENELQYLVQSINIPLLTIETFLGFNKDKIELKAAADLICNIINFWFGDGQDHYICLVDKNTGAYFWYNTRDGTTQWADNNNYEASTTAEAKSMKDGIAAMDDDEAKSSKESKDISSKESTEKSSKESKEVSSKESMDKSSKESKDEKSGPLEDKPISDESKITTPPKLSPRHEESKDIENPISKALSSSPILSAKTSKASVLEDSEQNSLKLSPNPNAHDQSSQSLLETIKSHKSDESAATSNAADESENQGSSFPNLLNVQTSSLKMSMSEPVLITKNDSHISSSVIESVDENKD